MSAAIPAITDVSIGTAALVAPDPTTSQVEATKGTAKQQQYVITTRLSRSFQQVDTIVITPVSIDLVERTFSDGQRTLTFAPSPHIQLYAFGPVGTSWSSRGSDPNSGATMTLNGTIRSTPRVRVCGQQVPGYLAAYSSTLTDPVAGEVISTSSSDPNTLVLAPQLGGLVLSQHIDTSDTRFQPGLGGYVGITLAYDSTLSSVVPERLP